MGWGRASRYRCTRSRAEITRQEQLKARQVIAPLLTFVLSDIIGSNGEKANVADQRGVVGEDVSQQPDQLQGNTQGVSTSLEKATDARGGNEAGIPAEEEEVGASQSQGEGAAESGSSVKNAATEAGREARHLDAIKNVARREWGQSWDIAQRKIASKPNYGRNLVDRLSKGAPKALNDVEHAALLDQLIQAENEASRPHSDQQSSSKKTGLK